MVHSMIEADEIIIVGYRPDGIPIGNENLKARARISLPAVRIVSIKPST